MVRGLRALSLVLDIVAACAYAFLVLGGRRLLPTPWLQAHLVNVFAGYAWPAAIQHWVGHRLERSARPDAEPGVTGVLAGGALALAGLTLFELGVQSDVTDFLVELPGVVLYALVNCARVAAASRRPHTGATDGR